MNVCEGDISYQLVRQAPLIVIVKNISGDKTRILPHFNIVLEVSVNAPNIPGKTENSNSLTETWEFKSVVLGTEGDVLMWADCPFVVPLAHPGRVLLVHNFVSIGDDMGGGFGHVWELFFLVRKVGC